MALKPRENEQIDNFTDYNLNNYIDSVNIHTWCLPNNANGQNGLDSNNDLNR